MKKYKNIIFIIIFIILSLGIIWFNKIVDPYELNTKSLQYQNWEMVNIERDFVYTGLNISKKFKFSNVVIGSSGISSVLTNYKFDGNVLLINLLSLSPTEEYELLKYYLKLHPETKNIIVSLELNTYLTCHHRHTIPNKPTNEFLDFIKAYYSVDAIKKSFDKLYGEKPIISEKGISYVSNSVFKYQHVPSCENDNILGLKKLIDLINEHKLNAIYYIPPTHGLYLANSLHVGMYEHQDNFKRQVAQLVSFYDSSFVNKYTSLPLHYLFKDVYHCSGEFLSKKAVNILTGKEKDDDFAVYITKDNVDEVLTKQKVLLQDYIKNNKTVVEKYINDDTDRLNYSNYDKIYYIKDLPKEIQALYEQNNKQF